MRLRTLIIIIGVFLCAIILLGMVWQLTDDMKRRAVEIRKDTEAAREENKRLDRELDQALNEAITMVVSKPEKFCRKEFCHG
jgi:hypothetical protein